jgi:hypothetical protein
MRIDLEEVLDDLEQQVFLEGQPVPVEKWHGIETAGKPDLVSLELLDVHFSSLMTHDQNRLKDQCQPNLPWAEDHFQERVSGRADNPGEQWKNWPWYPKQNKMYDQEFRSGDGRFTHTYMERLWSRKPGIRYRYGDLADVHALLLNQPLTRQAFVPIWFPEDTGAVHGGRVPCTIGYHFMQREGRLHLWYTIRSCDVIRYMRDDVYMAIRLAQWMLDKLAYQSDFWLNVTLGDFHFHAFSLHAFEGDRYVGQFAEGSGLSRSREFSR